MSGMQLFLGPLSIGTGNPLSHIWAMSNAVIFQGHIRTKGHIGKLIKTQVKTIIEGEHSSCT
jgi:hypothetical protein